MREVDRAMVEDFGIVLLQMMENAGRALAFVARERFLGATCVDTGLWYSVALAATEGAGWYALEGCTPGAAR